LGWVERNPTYNKNVKTIIPANPVTSYVAFLRGINVGGKKQIKMEELRNAFHTWSFENVATILASGNVLFDAHLSDPEKARKIITVGIKTTFGFEAHVFIRSMDELNALAAKDPFAGFSETAQTKLYVTFLNQKSSAKISIPYHSKESELRILQVTDREIFSVVTLTPKYGSTDMMAFLEKTFGSELTTRNWNTVVKILDHFQKTHQ
jgi:uncharacterized protein (DUF1697 family)